jgi:quinol monooxygenase YgiN
VIIFIANLNVPQRNAAAFEKLMTYVCAQSNENEPGVVFYGFAKSAETPDEYVVVEVYRDQEAVAHHGTMSWVQDSIPQYLELIEGMPRLVQYASPGTEPVQWNPDDVT